MLNAIKSRAAFVFYKPILKANYLLNNYQDVIWLVGDGRSGTTWVANLINHKCNYREMFEPFHPKKVRAVNFIAPHQYVRPDDPYEKLAKVASDIFCGKFTHARVDSGNQLLSYKGLLIKDIFANLLCCWAIKKFPKVKLILLIRNPFSVALSKYKMRHAFWMTDPLEFLNQTRLRNDYLGEFEDLIRMTCLKGDFILNQILIWSVIHYVPLKQFCKSDIHICFYENMHDNTNYELSKIFNYINGSPEEVFLDEAVVKRPSRVAGEKSNLVVGASPVSSWKNELSPKVIDDGLEILSRFKLDKLYEDSLIPAKRDF